MTTLPSGRLCGQGRDHQRLRASGGPDIGGARGGNDADFRLCDGQRDLDIEKGLQVVPIAE